MSSSSSASPPIWAFWYTSHTGGKCYHGSYSYLKEVRVVETVLYVAGVIVIVLLAVILIKRIL